MSQPKRRPFVEWLEDRCLLHSSGTGEVVLPLLDTHEHSKPDQVEVRSEDHSGREDSVQAGESDNSNHSESQEHSTDKFEAEDNSTTAGPASPPAENQHDAEESDGDLNPGDSKQEGSPMLGDDSHSGSSSSGSNSGGNSGPGTASVGEHQTSIEGNNASHSGPGGEVENEHEDKTAQNLNEGPGAGSTDDSSGSSNHGKGGGGGTSEGENNSGSISAPVVQGGSAGDVSSHLAQPAERRSEGSDAALALALAVQPGPRAETGAATPVSTQTIPASAVPDGERSPAAQETGRATPAMPQASAEDHGANRGAEEDARDGEERETPLPPGPAALNVGDPQAADVVFMSLDIGGLGQTLTDLLQSVEGQAAAWLPTPGSRSFWLWLAGISAGTGALAATFCLHPQWAERQRETLKQLLRGKRVSL